MLNLSPGGWLDLLEPRLDEQARAAQVFRDYYAGKHPLAFATTRFREAFGHLFAAMADNWMQVIVDAPVERMRIDGFRFGGSQADKDAWAVWQANNLDSQSIQAHTEAVKTGRAYLLVDPFRKALDSQEPLITVEHPCQMIVVSAAEDRRDRLAAFKKWKDDDEYVYATLYLPDRILKYRSQDKVRGDYIGTSRTQWQRRPDDEGGSNPLGRVPVVPLENNPDLLDGGRSDIAIAISNQNAINKLAADMLIASEFQSFRQRILTGVEVPKDPVTGLPVEQVQLRAAMTRVWAFEDPEARVYDLPAADLSNIEVAVEMFVRHLAAQTRTPPHYLLGKMENLAADALKAAETGLVARTRRKLVDYSDSWEDTLRLAFRAKDETSKAEEAESETLWADPESRSQSETADALTKLKTLGVPNRTLWRLYGFTPQEIDQMEKDAEAQAKAQPPPTVVVGQPNGSPNGGPPNGPQDQQPKPGDPAAASNTP